MFSTTGSRRVRTPAKPTNTRSPCTPPTIAPVSYCKSAKRARLPTPQPPYRCMQSNCHARSWRPFVRALAWTTRLLSSAFSTHPHCAAAAPAHKMQPGMSPDAHFATHCGALNKRHPMSQPCGVIPKRLFGIIRAVASFTVVSVGSFMIYSFRTTGKHETYKSLVDRVSSGVDGHYDTSARVAFE